MIVFGYDYCHDSIICFLSEQSTDSILNTICFVDCYVYIYDETDFDITPTNIPFCKNYVFDISLWREKV